MIKSELYTRTSLAEKIVSLHCKNTSFTYESHVNIITEIWSKIFGFLLGKLRQYSDIFVRLRESLEIFRNYRQSSESGLKLLDILYKQH